jgi:excisionase family DNA binding protein
MSLLTTAEVAAILNVKSQTLRKMRTHGDGPLFAKIGALVRYEQRDVSEWLARRMVRSTTDAGRLMADDPNGSLNESRTKPCTNGCVAGAE